ncbi:B3 domain-containing transcription factor VRN1-like isoform X2 [Cicer arietinum]|uniref:B3 domain-containing transcription factor VRN1-like isoform X2 n=1 Tax=Cicer arietinum TaxID=3827 RepID=UPI003CC5D4F1
MSCNQQTKHSHPSIIRFFKVITSTTLQDGKLRIPNSFTKKHGNDTSNPIFLKTPDGKKWKIYLTKKDGDIWFHKGWMEFAKHYSLDHGHMMFFQCEEKETSQFDVHIFDKSTLEIEYNVHGTQHNLEQNSDNNVEIWDKPPNSFEKSRLKSPILPCSQPHKKLKTETREGVGTSSNLQTLPMPHVQASEDMDGGTECLKMEHEQEQLIYKMNEALNRARSFKSKNPSFIMVIKPSYLYYYSLYVPSQFSINYLKKKQSDILLQLLDGRTWHARYSYGKIKVGWRKFVEDNKLENGDVCLFELTKSQALTLKVLIFRDEEQPHSSPPKACNHYLR